MPVLAYILASDAGLELWRVTWAFAVTCVVFVTSLKVALTASLRPLPPPLHDAGAWRAALSRFPDKERCLILCLVGRLGRWSLDTLLLLPCGNRLVLPAVCCWGRWLEAEERKEMTLVPLEKWIPTPYLHISMTATLTGKDMNYRF